MVDTVSGCAGILPAGASRTVTVVAQALPAGPLPRTVSASTTTQESTRANNVASASTVVTAAPSAVRTYSTGTIASPIPRPGQLPTHVPIAVPAGAGISLDLDVLLRANHGDVSSLDIALIAPDGTTVALSSNNGVSTARNYGTGPNDCSGTPTVFDDSQATSVVDGDAPFAGTFRPEGELSDALGTAVHGDLLPAHRRSGPRAGRRRGLRPAAVHPHHLTLLPALSVGLRCP